MNFVNNWLYQLAGGFAPGELALPLPAGALERLALAEGDQYTLTLAASLSPASPDETEIIRLTGTASGYTLARGLEGTQEQSWPEGTQVWCTLTAGGLMALFERIAQLDARVAALESGGGDLPSNVLVDSAGSALVDSEGNYLTHGA